MSAKKFLKRLALALLLLLAWASWITFKSPADVEIKAVHTAFPADFIWGVSSSGFQSEGGDLDSNWNRLHQKPDSDPVGLSVDFRHRYAGDIKLAHDLGVNTYRIGINWARVEPREGHYDEKELAYYDDVIGEMKKAGIAPLVTLDHFVYPGWVAAQGGWTKQKTVNDFVRFSSMIAQRYHGDVHLWITFNEATNYIASEVFGRHLGLSDSAAVRRNVISAHRQVYDVIHKIDGKAIVTSNIVWFGDESGTAPIRAFADWLFLNQIADKCDAISLDYYASSIIRVAKAKKEWAWPLDPPGLYRALRLLGKQFPDKPLLIAETGMATENGKPRADGLKRDQMIRDTVYWTQRAREDGVNVMGYMVWSLTDNYEWGHFAPRFGLFSVDALGDKTLARVPTEGVAAYQDLIRNHGVSSDYRPQAPK